MNSSYQVVLRPGQRVVLTEESIPTGDRDAFIVKCSARFNDSTGCHKTLTLPQGGDVVSNTDTLIYTVVSARGNEMRVKNTDLQSVSHPPAQPSNKSLTPTIALRNLEAQYVELVSRYAKSENDIIAALTSLRNFQAKLKKLAAAVETESSLQKNGIRGFVKKYNISLG